MSRQEAVVLKGGGADKYSGYSPPLPGVQRNIAIQIGTRRRIIILIGNAGSALFLLCNKLITNQIMYNYYKQ